MIFRAPYLKVVIKRGFDLSSATRRRRLTVFELFWWLLGIIQLSKIPQKVVINPISIWQIHIYVTLRKSGKNIHNFDALFGSASLKSKEGGSSVPLLCRTQTLSLFMLSEKEKRPPPVSVASPHAFSSGSHLLKTPKLNSASKIWNESLNTTDEENWDKIMTIKTLQRTNCLSIKFKISKILREDHN